jgi:hypothetical protein
MQLQVFVIQPQRALQIPRIDEQHVQKVNVVTGEASLEHQETKPVAPLFEVQQRHLVLQVRIQGISPRKQESSNGSFGTKLNGVLHRIKVWSHVRENKQKPHEEDENN